MLLTGLGSKRLGWARQLEVFGRAYRTIALDLRDTGDSDEVAEAYTPADLADDAAAVLDALGIAHTHVVGISLGGFTALQFALRHANMLDKLALVATSPGGSVHVPAAPEILALLAPDPGMEVGERAIRTYSQIMAAEFVAAHPEELERIAETARYRPQSPAAYMRQVRATLAHDVVDALDRITAPIANARHPRRRGPTRTAAERGLSRGAYHRRATPRLPWCGADIPIIERADEFNRDVLAFLAADAQPVTTKEA